MVTTLQLLLVVGMQEDCSALIRQLGSNDVEARESAARHLKLLGPRAKNGLASAEKDTDPEVAGRARELLRFISSITRDVTLHLKSLSVHARLQGESISFPLHAQDLLSWEEMLKTAQKWRGRHGNVSADALFTIAQRHFYAGNFEKAHGYCEQVVEIAPNHMEGNSLLLEIAFLLGKIVPKNFRRHHDASSDTLIGILDSLLLEAIEAFRQRDWEIAHKHAREILDAAKEFGQRVDIATRTRESELLLVLIEKSK